MKEIIQDIEFFFELLYLLSQVTNKSSSNKHGSCPISCGATIKAFWKNCLKIRPWPSRAKQLGHFGDHQDGRGWTPWLVEEFSHRQGSSRWPGVATPVPLREPRPLDTNNTLLGTKVLGTSGWPARVTRFCPKEGMHKIAYLEKNPTCGQELHGEYWGWNEGCKFQLAPAEPDIWVQVRWPLSRSSTSFSRCFKRLFQQ